MSDDHQENYLLTTILKKPEITENHCAATTLGFLVILIRLCAESMKRLRRKVFVFDRLIDPTLCI